MRSSKAEGLLNFSCFFFWQRARASKSQSMRASAMTLDVAVTLLTFGRAYFVSRDASCVTSFQRGRHVWASRCATFFGVGSGVFFDPNPAPSPDWGSSLGQACRRAQHAVTCRVSSVRDTQLSACRNVSNVGHAVRIVYRYEIVQ